MNYPDEFKQEAQRLYPDWSELHERIEQGSIAVGELLGDGIFPYFTLQDFLQLTPLEALKDRADGAGLDKVALYKWWNRLMGDADVQQVLKDMETVKHG